MDPGDEQLVRALVHDANVRLTGSSAEDLGHDGDLDAVRQVLAVAEKILNGKASAEEKASVPNIVHPQVRSLYLS
jgi:hypothetical protein